MKSLYVMTVAQIESLAAERMTNAGLIEGLDGTYLRVIVTAIQEKLGTSKKRIMMNTQLAALEAVVSGYYAAVLRGVTTKDVADDPAVGPGEATRRSRERNRRATFARTAKSTLVQWVREGGDIRTLDASTVSKGELRASVAAARVEARGPQSPALAIIELAATKDPVEQRETLEAAIRELQAALDGLDETEAPQQRRGAPWREHGLHSRAE